MTDFSVTYEIVTANSANNYLDVLKRASQPLPERIAAKAKMLQQCGWKV